jgi:DNA-binding NarL/FixJ family response regulator
MPFLQALIIEDLDEPREWLADLLPVALPTLKQVDTAENLREANTRLASKVYDLAIVDWHLPDGISEALIQQLTAEHPETVVVVATIHDDDSHVFPALRAGATGYILKSQPRSVVISQLRGIEVGEPALSPSIAMRVLKHFNQAGAAMAINTTTAAVADDLVHLTAREIDVLRLIGKGYKAAEAGKLLEITTHTVSGYIRDIYRKLEISSRAEATMEAARRGLIA